MKANNKKTNKLNKVIYIILFLPVNLFASNLSVGTGYIYAKVNDPKLRYIKELEFNQPMLNIGLSDNYKRVFYGVNTNRLFNQYGTRSVIDNNDRVYQLRSKFIIDTFTVGYVDKISPFLFIGNVVNKKQLISNNNIIKGEKESAIVYGVGLSKRIKQHSFNLNLIAPCQALKVEYAIGIGYSYNFKIN